ncbi:unnamed protein product [Dibothriocephalus latus]|uniref:BHLH domain-containing protein n=1 Tax=Dibothriocephalus latus TaxID=60516 RepID=A0A3P6Q9S4_DIBLA|nr:unnamed protein product [Dibothriocephalus latus]
MNEDGSPGKNKPTAALPAEMGNFSGNNSHFLWCCEGSTTTSSSASSSPLGEKSGTEDSPYSGGHRRHQFQRVKANARERQRVHTIGAAFETLRRSVPTAGSSTRLSKLAVLRIAASYIETLAACLEANPKESATEEEVRDLPEDLSLKGSSLPSPAPDPLIRFDTCIRKLNRMVRAEARSRR